MIPYELLQDRRNIDNLLQYLTFELRKTQGERAGLEADWERGQRLYRAKPKEERRSFPWPGAANLEVPLIATDVDTTVAGLMGALWAAPNLWSTEALRPDWIEFSAKLQEFMEAVQNTELKMYDVCTEWITELTKLGTGILKWRYLRDERKVFEWREIPGGALSQLVRRVVANRPSVSRVALADFYIPATASSVQEAPWVAERVQLTWDQLQRRVAAGIYDPAILDRLGWYWRQNQPQSQFGNYQNIQQQLDNFVPGIGDKFELFEFWTKYDVDRDGEQESILCTIHVPSNTYARIDFNPFFNQEFPYTAARFIRQEGRFYGLGLCEILEHFQEEIGAMHRQRIDNGTIRNAAVFKGRRGSGIRADEPVWPGRTVLMDNPETDMVPMQMGIAAESTIDDEQFTLQYARMRSGIGDYQRGGAGNPAISYSTATTTVEMLRQGKLRLDQVMREIQNALSDVGRNVVELYQQFDQQGKPFKILGQADGAYVDAVLKFPLDLVREGVAIRVTATNAQLNKETQIRTNQMVFGMVMQFYNQMMGAAQVAFNPQLPPPMQQIAFNMMAGGMVLTRRMLQEYDIQDADRIVPDMFGGNDAPPTLAGPQPYSGGAGLGPVPQGSPGFPGLGPGPGGVNAAGPTDPSILARLAGAFSGPGQVQQGY